MKILSNEKFGTGKTVTLSQAFIDKNKVDTEATSKV